MKKKTLSIFVIILLIFTIIIPIANSKILNIKHNECDCEKKIDIKNNDYREEYAVMVAPPELPDPSKGYKKSTIIDTPDYFSWLDHNGQDWTTPAKNQGPCGSCWAFAALSALESIIEIREGLPNLNPDLSEQYILSCLSSAGGCYGGNTLKALENIMNTSEEGNFHNGIIPEECFYYLADDDILCSEKCNSWQEQLIPISDFGYWSLASSSNNREEIKSEIIQNGPVAGGILANDLFKIWGALNHDSTDYYPYLRKSLFLNHVVLILGWKDDPSIGRGGYWICKNSWGEDWGYNGYFNIEYGSLNIDSLVAYWVDYDPESYHWPPKADTGGSYSAKENEIITFDASNSIGYEGNIVEYYWDFGDNTKGYGKIATHSYSEKGEFIVSLTVMDDFGSKTQKITKARIQDSLNNPPNKPTVKGPSVGGTNKEYEFSFVSTDPDNDPLYYSVDWGDGTVDEWIGVFFSNEEQSKTHIWKEEKSYNIKVKAIDIYGAESEWSDSISITIPRNKLINNLIFNILIEHFQNFFFLFRLLRY